MKAHKGHRVFETAILLGFALFWVAFFVFAVRLLG